MGGGVGGSGGGRKTREQNRKGTWRAVRAQQCADQWECPHSLALSHRGAEDGGGGCWPWCDGRSSAKQADRQELGLLGGVARGQPHCQGSQQIPAFVRSTELELGGA